MTKCYMCGEPATWMGHCDEHRGILRKQLVLDLLDEVDEPRTAIQIRDGIRDRFQVFLSYRQTSAAIHSLHHGGFLVKHPTSGVNHGAQWSMV